ncbi:hypothetical protein ZWY2020_060019 [Hordeum vulgare]|nr:hypothetical protein ZWY2020_060019 [Hordeum vulgare]
MEALVVRKLGDPTLPPGGEESPFAAVSGDRPIPELSSPTSVRVRVAATSLNFATFLQVQGKYQERPPLPFVPGSDYAGVVDAVGPGVRRLRPGDRVCSLASVGSFAEFIVADEKALYVVPDGCDLVAAGALPVAFGTSYLALAHRAQLKAGQVLLVLGAAMCWGICCTDRKSLCAIVIAGVEKLQYLKSIGADHVIDSSKENVIESAKTGQFMVCTGKLLNSPPAVLIDSLNELLSWLSKGLITVKISHTYRLTEAHLAFADLRDRKVTAK